MRLLTNEEIRQLELCTIEDNYDLNDQEIVVVEGLVRRGFIRKSFECDDKWKWTEYNITPKGKWALSLVKSMNAGVRL